MNVGTRAKFDNARRVGDEPDDDHDGRGDRERDPATGRIIGTLAVVKMPRVGFLERRFWWEPKRWIYPLDTLDRWVCSDAVDGQ